MFNVGELVAFLRLDEDQFNRALEAAPRKAKSAGDSIERAMGGAEKATRSVGDAAVVTGARTEEMGKKSLGAGKAFGALAGVRFAEGIVVSEPVVREHLLK